MSFPVPSLWPWEEEHALLTPLLTYIACHFLVILFSFEMIAYACDPDHFSITLHLLELHRLRAGPVEGRIPPVI